MPRPRRCRSAKLRPPRPTGVRSVAAEELAGLAVGAGDRKCCARRVGRRRAVLEPTAAPSAAASASYERIGPVSPTCRVTGPRWRPPQGPLGGDRRALAQQLPVRGRHRKTGSSSAATTDARRLGGRSFATEDAVGASTELPAHPGPRFFEFRFPAMSRSSGWSTARAAGIRGGLALSKTGRCTTRR